MKKIRKGEKEILIFNFTPHQLDFVKDALPYSLATRRVDFSVESDGVLTAKTNPQTEEHNNITIIKTNFTVKDDDVATIQEIIEGLKEDEVAIIYVSKIFLDALKARNFQVKSKNYVIGMPVSATKREVKPPVAIAFAVGM